MAAVASMVERERERERERECGRRWRLRWWRKREQHDVRGAKGNKERKERGRVVLEASIKREREREGGSGGLDRDGEREGGWWWGIRWRGKAASAKEKAFVGEKRRERDLGKGEDGFEGLVDYVLIIRWPGDWEERPNQIIPILRREQHPPGAGH
ncbi:hypothetical protein TIFTF001_015549 [Ficus carica]|uniref:Uncharacterized protein n=1 Tax=Ficus carica TaxID=3494 RepID=A0AA88A5V7_FICCA|nr:hypothetical protein TIFTF001_015549 [Ficus carica]